MTGWMSQAACAGADTNLFFQDGEKGRGDRLGPGKDPHRAARAICSSCPVILQCRKWATDNREYGFAGGMTAAERDAARRRKQRGSVGPPTVVTRDDDATRHRLWQAGLSDPAIAAEVGRTTTAIRDWRAARGMQPNATGNRPIPQWRLDLYQSMWDSGLTDKQIAEGTNTTTGAVKAWRRKRGMQAHNTAKVSA